MNTKNILGLPFFVGSVTEAVERTLNGALVVAPSGPNLAGELQRVPAYRSAVQSAGVILTDSSVMVAVYKLATGRSVPRHSGLKFLEALLGEAPLRDDGAVFWVMPSESESESIGAWLRTQGFAVNAGNTYVAPFYPKGPIEDPELLRRIAAFGPKVVVLNLAGGKQEVLGAWLHAGLGAAAPGIVCTGAAVAFLAGTQANIPTWTDRLGLGWAARCLSNPMKFVPRYVRALPLLPLVWKYKDSLPPIAAGVS